MSPIRGTLPIWRQYEKWHILGILRLSCALYYEKAHVKTDWEDPSQTRPKFLKSVASNRFTVSISTEMWDRHWYSLGRIVYFPGGFIVKHGYFCDKFPSRR